VCPWNRFAKLSKEADFDPRHGLDNSSLLDCFGWSEDDFDTRTLGSAIRRIGYQSWIRNIVIALGNANYNPHIIACLKSAYVKHNGFIQEHIDWAINQQQSKQQSKQQ
jgi:epoxyqueuosine reductase